MCTRFLPVFGSGTRLNQNVGPDPSVQGHGRVVLGSVDPALAELGEVRRGVRSHVVAEHVGPSVGERPGIVAVDAYVFQSRHAPSLRAPPGMFPDDRRDSGAVFGRCAPNISRVGNERVLP
jgi:hypothetical protein